MTLAGMDIAMIAVVTISVITGVMRGFLREIIALFAWILAIWLSFKQCHLVAAWLSPYILDRTIQLGAGFLIILIGILILAAIVNAILGLILRHSGLGIADRMLGLGFGFIRGVLIVSLVIVLIDLIGFNIKPYQANSRFYAYFQPVVEGIISYVQPLLTQNIKKSKTIESDPSKTREPGL